MKAHSIALMLQRALPRALRPSGTFGLGPWQRKLPSATDFSRCCPRSASSASHAPRQEWPNVDEQEARRMGRPFAEDREDVDSRATRDANSEDSAHTGEEEQGDAGNSSEDDDHADLYTELGVARGAGPDELRAAYRRLAKECHPDLNPTDPAAAAARFRRVSHAHNTLQNLPMRRLYDLHLRRSEAFVRRDRMEEESKSEFRRLFDSFPIAVSAAASLLGMFVLLAGAREWVLRYPGSFWAWFRYVPNWAPGKWWLAELYADAAQRRGTLRCPH